MLRISNLLTRRFQAYRLVGIRRSSNVIGASGKIYGGWNWRISGCREGYRLRWSACRLQWQARGWSWRAHGDGQGWTGLHKKGLSILVGDRPGQKLGFLILKKERYLEPRKMPSENTYGHICRYNADIMIMSLPESYLTYHLHRNRIWAWAWAWTLEASNQNLYKGMFHDKIDETKRMKLY